MPLSDLTPMDDQMEDPERFKLYRLCGCEECHGSGKVQTDPLTSTNLRCMTCRGEGRVLAIIATCGTPEAVGVALVTLGREGEWDGCNAGILDSLGEKNQKWLVNPWQVSPSARNMSEAGRVLRSARTA